MLIVIKAKMSDRLLMRMSHCTVHW